MRDQKLLVEQGFILIRGERERLSSELFPWARKYFEITLFFRLVEEEKRRSRRGNTFWRWGRRIPACNRKRALLSLLYLVHCGNE